MTTPDPTKGRFILTLRGEPVQIASEDIPTLFVAYVSAERAKWYAGVDAAKGDDFTTVFFAEFNYALRHTDEVQDWLGNNMNLPTPTKDTVGVVWEYEQTEILYHPAVLQRLLPEGMSVQDAISRDLND